VVLVGLCTVSLDRVKYDIMKAVSEIEATLAGLSTEDLHHVEVKIHELYRSRHERVIYDDAYGIWLEDDQASAAAEAFRLIDEEEEGRAGADTR
jgi:hypothetical protein